MWKYDNESTNIYIRHIGCRKESSDDDNNDKNQKSSSLSWMGPRARSCFLTFSVSFILSLFNPSLSFWFSIYSYVFCAKRGTKCARRCCLLCSLCAGIVSFCFYCYFCSNLQLKHRFRLYHFRPSHECDFTSISKDAHIQSFTHSIHYHILRWIHDISFLR